MGQWALGYGAGAVVILGILDAVNEPLNMSLGAQRVVLVLLVVGFLVTLVLSWYHGEEGRQHVQSSEVALLFLVGLAGLAGIWLVAGAEAPVQEAGVPVADSQAVRAVGETGAVFHSAMEHIPEDYVASVAVLPLEVLSPPELQEADERLAAGLHEELINRLTATSDIFVTSRPSVLAIEGRNLLLSEMADELGVEYFITGAWRREGEQVRVNIQLADPRSDQNVYSVPYEVDLDDPFAMQEQVAGAVAELVRLLGGQDLPEVEVRALNPAAHQAYLTGQTYSRFRTPESLAEAIRAFKEAVSLDGGYARAYAALSSQFILWVTYDYAGIDPYEAYAWAVVLADRAVALGPNLAEAHLARGFALSKAWAPSEMALAEFEAAVELKPGSSDVLGWYAHVLARERLYNESLLAAGRAVELDPYTPGRDVGFTLDALGARRYELALAQADRALMTAPNLDLPRALKAFALLLLDRPDECLELDLTDYDVLRAMCLHSIDQPEEARELVESLLAASENRPPSYIEAYYAWVGDGEEAFRWLQRSYARSPNGPDFRIIHSGIFDPIREAMDLDNRLDAIRSEIWDQVLGTARTLDVDAVPVPVVGVNADRDRQQ